MPTSIVIESPSLFSTLPERTECGIATHYPGALREVALCLSAAAAGLVSVVLLVLAVRL
jgi:hypothetical protein